MKTRRERRADMLAQVIKDLKDYQWATGKPASIQELMRVGEGDSRDAVYSRTKKALRHLCAKRLVREHRIGRAVAFEWVAGDKEVDPLKLAKVKRNMAPRTQTITSTMEQKMSKRPTNYERLYDLFKNEGDRAPLSAIRAITGWSSASSYLSELKRPERYGKRVPTANGGIYIVRVEEGADPIYERQPFPNKAKAKAKPKPRTVPQDQLNISEALEARLAKRTTFNTFMLNVTFVHNPITGMVTLIDASNEENIIVPQDDFFRHMVVYFTDWTSRAVEAIASLKK